MARGGRFAWIRAAGILGASFVPALAGAMEFSTLPIGPGCDARECPRVVIARGEIDSGAPQNFTAFLQGELQRPGLHAVVFLTSPGGNVESALRLGSLLNRSGAVAVVGRPVLLEGRRPNRRGKFGPDSLGVVPGHCASACVYTLMGAKKRVVPQGARVGVHRMSANRYGYDPGGGGTNASRIYAGSAELKALRSYVAKVGGSQDLISLAESIPHDRIHMLTPQEIRRFRLGAPRF